MASKVEDDCLSNPNFAVICSFMDRYAENLCLPEIGYKDLQEWIEDSKKVNPLLIDLHVRLLRRIHKKFSSVTADRWERGVVRFCHKYSNVDAWEIERFGYKLAKISTKLTLLKNLMESQFDCNNKFKDKINETPLEEMRFQPVGRDKNGMAYWYFLDKELNLRVYREHQDDVDSESWELVCSNRDDLSKLVTSLEYGTDLKIEKQESSDQSEPVSDFNEDSRDSFKQKTPMGPSPLTIKQDPGDSDGVSGDSKQPIVLKISKLATQSPSKMLKDKFVKEKGSEIQKIMCKMKQEGLVDSDSDEDADSITNKDKTDEVDGPIDKASIANEENSEVISKTNHKEETKEDISDTSNEVKSTKEVSKQTENITTENNADTNLQKSKDTELSNIEAEGNSETKESDTLGKTEDEVTDQIENKLTENDQKLEDDKCISSSDSSNDNEIKQKAVPTVAKLPEQEISVESRVKGEISENNEKGSEHVDSNCSKDTVTCELEKDQKESKHKAKENKNDSSEIAIEEVTKQIKNKSHSTSSDTGQNIDSSEGGKGETDTVSDPQVSKPLSDKDVDNSLNKNEDIDSAVKDADKGKCEDNAEEHSKDETDDTKRSVTVITETKISESQDDTCENKSDKKLEQSLLDSVDNIETSPKSNEKESENVQATESEVANDSVKSVNSCASATVHSENSSSNATVTDNSGKKARKRKNDESKAEASHSSTDEDIENETAPPSKRTVKTAVRKSPNKKSEENVMRQTDTEKTEITDSCETDRTKENSLEKDHEKDEESECLNVGETSEKAEDENAEEISADLEKDELKNITEKANIGEDVQEKVKGEEKKELENDADISAAEEREEQENEPASKPQRKVKGLVAHSRRSKSKAQKRQAENSDDMEPVEPASKKSKLRGRVSSKGRGKRRGVSFDSSSSSSDDDLPLSQMAGRGRGSNSRGKGSPAVGKHQNEAVKDPPKKKKVEEDATADKTEIPEIPDDLSEEDTGRRRSARVRSLRARKQKSPSPDYVPSELEDSEEEFLLDVEDEEFILKSKKRKKKEPKEVIEEIPKGRNALRHEAQTKKKGGKPIEEEEEDEEAACVKCLRSHQPEWILLCDKCDAGHHTACLRPPLMIIPDGDWYCPPCEHTMLKEKLEENLKSLDLSILKNDRLTRRKERLAFVSVSLDNVLKEPEPELSEPSADNKGRKQRRPNYRESGGSDSSSSGETGSSDSTSESESSSEGERTRSKKAKPKYIQRACRTKKSVSYRFEEFDELIMDAIEEDLSIPKEPKPRKTKPPGINRGKDMSNILGVSDEETPKKPQRKRRPRLTELDEDVDDDDDTDDYKVSEASDASDATKSYDSEEISEGSIESEWRYNSRSTRKSRRKGGRSRRYRDDFVVDSDFESDEDNSRRSKRRTTRRGKVNYRELNSDETEVDDESFHSSELSDSDFESKRKKRIERKKKQMSKERPRSGKRQRIRKVSSSSESSETESDDATPQKKRGKKPPSKSARYDSDETDESVEKTKVKKSSSRKLKELSDMSESEAEETEVTESSDTEVSEADVKETRAKQKKTVIKSKSENDEDTDKTDVNDKEANESHNSEDTEGGSGWEEIGVESDDESVTNAAANKKGACAGVKSSPKGKKKGATELLSEKEHMSQKENLNENDIQEKECTNVTDVPVNESSSAEVRKETIDTAHKEEDKSETEVTPTKKKRGRKSKAEKAAEQNTSTEEVTPKKRGRKPKVKPEPVESNADETPVKKKRGRNSKSDTCTLTEIKTEIDESHDKKEADGNISVEANTELSQINNEKCIKMEQLGEQTSSEKTEAENMQSSEKMKDDSPLSARNKQNAPVGVVKPEVRQGVIVENKQAVDGRMNENRPSEHTVNPLQGMRDLAMGNQNAPGTHPSSFTPYSQSSYGNQNMPGYTGHPGYQGYPHQAHPYGQGGPGSNHPYQGPQGMPHGPPQQYPSNQAPMSPNSYQQHGSFMGQMQQGPHGYYHGNYRPPIGHPEGFGSPNPHGNQHGQPPPYFHPQTPYQGQRPGYPEHSGHYMSPQGPIPHSQSGPGPYQSMPYNYSNMPQQPMHRPVYGPHRPSSMSPNQPPRPQTRVPGPIPVQQGLSPNPKADSDPPNRGFMMDNILKSTTEGPSTDVEDSAEVSDIDRYTSFLCKTSD